MINKPTELNYDSKIFNEKTSNEVKYAMIKSAVDYIDKYTKAVRDVSGLLNRYIDELDISDEEIDIPLGNLVNAEGSEEILKLFREKLNIEKR